MYRALEINDAKNIPIRKAGEAMTRGAAVVVDRTDGTLIKATATYGFGLVDVAPNFDGINAVITPTDDMFENITVGQTVLEIPIYMKEAHATTEVDAANLVRGDLVKAVNGKIVKAEVGDLCDMFFDGAYSDPTGLPMYRIEKLATPIQA